MHILMLMSRLMSMSCNVMCHMCIHIQIDTVNMLSSCCSSSSWLSWFLWLCVPIPLFHCFDHVCDCFLPLTLLILISIRTSSWSSPVSSSFMMPTSLTIIMVNISQIIKAYQGVINMLCCSWYHHVQVFLMQLCNACESFLSCHEKRDQGLTPPDSMPRITTSFPVLVVVGPRFPPTPLWISTTRWHAGETIHRAFAQNCKTSNLHTFWSKPLVPPFRPDVFAAWQCLHWKWQQSDRRMAEGVGTCPKGPRGKHYQPSLQGVQGGSWR